ncbi:hypothetical protein HY251_09515, partial [bacterium]|nr:hypothetical protein [bacterium]
MVDALQRPQPPATQGEPAWVALARGSDEQREAALHELHGRHKDEVFSFLLKLLQDRALAEDVLQDSFL